MKTHRILLTGLASALLLAGCASIAPAPAGPYAIGKSHVSLQKTWSVVTPLMLGLPKEGQVLSINGPYLDRLYILDGLPEGGSLIKAVKKENPTPVFRKGLTATEQIEFVSDSVAALGYERVVTSRPRPAKMDGKDALRFDLTLRTTGGLDLSGAALAAVVNDKLYLVLFLAPSEHYYQTMLPDVEQIMSSFKIG